MTKQPIPYILLLLLLFLAACGDEADTTTLAGNQPIEVQASIHQTTRGSIAGEQFADGDTFTLYEGTPGETGKASAEYNTTDGTTWTGELYWDDLQVWDNGVLTTGTTRFTATTANGEDLLVAYAAARVRDGATARKLSLTFKHILAHLVITIAEEDVDNFNIMGAETSLTLNGIQTEKTITYNTADDAATATTTVTPTGTPGSVTLRNVSDVAAKSYKYEVILPAQSLENDVTLTINNNENGKEYTYNISTANINIKEGDVIDKDKILQQGYITTLSLKIQKTEITGITATLREWTTASASAPAYPTDYPVIELGDDDDGGDGPGLEEGEDYAGKTIRLTSDIDASKLGVPIGSKNVPFRGIFDGQGYTIRNVELDDTDEDVDFLGVFGYTDGAAIKNVNIEIVKVKNTGAGNNTATGGLAGYINNTSIDNCHVFNYAGNDKTAEGVSAAYNNAGGLVGYVNGASNIRNSSAAVNVTAAYDFAGGLIGQSKERMTLTQCFATGNATAGSYKGETAIGGNYAGGLIGRATEGEITFSYAWGCAKAAIRYAGGLLGRSDAATVANCYAAAPTVSGGSRQAGLIGYTETAINNCYWNNTSIADNIGVGVVGITPNNTNASFTLTKVKAAMSNIINSLNTTGETVNEIWTLTETDNYIDKSGTVVTGYFLPTLVNNIGKTFPAEAP